MLTIAAPAYLLMLWLFRPDDFNSPLMVLLSMVSLILIVALWVAFSMLQRRIFK